MGGVYMRGNAITLVERFSAVNPLTGVATPADPLAVVFIIRDPDGVETTYTWGTDLNVSHLEPGMFLCALPAELPTGAYTWRCEGSGELDAVGEGDFTILRSGVLSPADPTVPQAGPCSGWIDGGYVARFDDSLGVGSSSYLLDPVAEMASHLMYALTARQFPGICQRKVRPCRQTCSCFGSSPSLGLGTWYWTSGAGVGGWNWRNECGDSCGCGSESYIRLAGVPVRKILAVKLDGVVLDPVTDYRLDGSRDVIRLPDMTQTPPTNRAWPNCQDLALNDSQPGTLSVVYEWGQDPPELGRMAAAQLAVELWRASPANQGDCRLPAKVTRVVRQGIEMDRVTPLASLLKQGATGLPLVDSFVALANPQGAKMRSLVWSPDVQPKARQIGEEWA